MEGILGLAWAVLSDVIAEHEREENLLLLQHLCDQYQSPLGAAPPPQPTNQTPSFAFISISHTVPRGSTLPRRTRINTTKIVEVKEDELASIDKCSICWKNFIQGDQRRILECNHYFHKDCIDKWLCEYKAECPLCKRVVL